MPKPSWLVARGVPGGEEIESYRDVRSWTNLSVDEQYFLENAGRASVVCESSDPEASYSYDDYALCELDGEYFLFNTSGCSCPSPDETWVLVWRAQSKHAALAKIDLKVAEASSSYHACLAAIAKVWPGWFELPTLKIRGDW